MKDISREAIQQAAQSDMGAFEDIYRTTCGFVYNVALRVAGNKEEAEEITQDVFIKVHKNLRKFCFQSSFRTWVYRITVNTAINASKKRSRETGRMVEYNDALKVADRPSATQEVADKEKNEKLIESLLGVLNSDQRACVVLRGIEGLSYEEIAKTLNTNINTVRTRLKRARTKMLDHFKNRGEK